MHNKYLKIGNHLSVRKISTGISAVLIAVTLTSCADRTKAGTSEVDSATISAEVPSKTEASIYEPKDGEHRFTEILETIQTEQKVTFQHGKDKVLTFAYCKDTDQYVILDSMWLKLGFGAGNSLSMTSYKLIQKNDKGEYCAYWINPDEKLYGYTMATIDGNYDSSPTFYEATGIDESNLTGIPDWLSPNYWTYTKSGTIDIFDTQYYYETYDFVTSKLNYSFDIVFDPNGDVTYIGESEFDDSPSVSQQGYTENEAALKNLFYEPANIYSNPSFAPSSLVKPKYKQYITFSVKPEFDSEQYKLNEYETIPDTFEYKNRLIEDKYEAVKKELGIDFDF